ncbi:MAG TPA: carbamoyltransferase [Bacteroidales bacterium]|nr:MAG: Decarbamoylnovobiocin carbamoyltransferase [Bacteroidetes bacterium ADurb.Bin041]HNV50989.1 carbamoyltransferase [Bacteroidales bacterium]HPL10938.1 carbamoyltransferase [Bacteroidales bacterium]HPW42645.1 carbamoyltransferase [Bacteroidales bacterium]HQF02058.1 carbamoyltransferase [Bacteroidales bacterium]
MIKILGISAFYHDSAAALIIDGEIIAAAQEERFTRKKHTPDFPVNAVRYCLEHSGYTIDELDAIVFYDKPLLKFERLLETYYAFVPRGLRQFIVSIPVWLKEKMFLKKMLYEGLAEIEKYNKKKLKLLFPEHHLSHAASAFYPSPFKEAAILTVDGVGEWATATICQGKDNKISLLKEMRFPHSVGLLYSAFTFYLGFRVNSGEYKLMGLAPYGNPKSEQTKNFIKLINKEIVTVKDDGSIWLNQKYFNYATGLKMVNESKWEKLFGFPAVKPDGKIEQKHCDLAYAIQKITEDIVIKMAKEAKRITGSDFLCMSGGVALNCVANGKLVRENVFKEIFIQPAAGDAGGALGAAQIAHHMYFDQKRETPLNGDSMKGAYLGPDFSDKEAVISFKKHKAVYHYIDSFDELCSEVSDLIDKGNVVGWFQGRMEFGPRALGNRSILGDARNKEMQKKLNLKIKYRESFRPFAPSVLIESSNEFFDLPVSSPYMLLIADVNKERRNTLPENYNELDLWEKLYFERSDVQAITHLDFSARVQTVHKETNPRYWQLINTFKEKTGYGIVVNTSFNVRGEPIVCTPEDAYKCFMRTEMDYLVVNNFLLKKTEQPDWKNRDKWMVEFKPD